MKKINKRPILVTGIPRSGTTWLGHIISFADGVRYLHEPFHPGWRNRNIRNSPFSTFFKYIRSDAEISGEIETIYQYTKNCLNYKVPGLFNLNDWRNKRRHIWWHQPIYQVINRIKKTIPLMKDPTALLASEWLYKQFNFRVIIIIRHPAAFYESIKRANWGRFGADTFLNQPLLMQDYLFPFKEQLEKDLAKKTTLIENNLLFWNYMHHIILEYRKKYPEWIFVRHEDLSLNTMAEISAIYNKLVLEFTKKVEKKIKKTITAQTDSRLERDSKKNAVKWKTKLKNEEINFIKEYTRKYWTHFYTESDW